MDVPLVAWSATGGHVCLHIYILSVSSSARSIAAKARRLFVCVALASEGARQSFRRCLRLPLCLLSAGRAAAAGRRRRLRRTVAITLLSCFLCRLAARRLVVMKTPLNPSRELPSTVVVRLPGLPRRLSAVLKVEPPPGRHKPSIGHRKGNPCFQRCPPRRLLLSRFSIFCM